MNNIEAITQKLKDNRISPQILAKWQVLTNQLKELDAAVVAYSGGVDSTFLAHVVHQVMGEKSCAVYVLTEAETKIQTELAKQWAEESKFPFITISHSSLSDPQFVANPINRCYFCKKVILELIHKYASENGFITVLEGQNQDDKLDYRPGRQAVKETGTLSPLADAGITKAEIRALARALGLSVWNLASSPCLASRFPYGSPITQTGLERVEKSEAYLRQIGFNDVRVRIHQDLARIEVSPVQIDKLITLGNDVTGYLKTLGFLYITVDLQGYRQGSLNEGLTK